MATKRCLDLLKGLAALTVGALSGQPAFAQTCGGPAQRAGVVRAIADGRTLVLADGRHVLLMGIEIPSALTGHAASALAAGFVGRQVVLRGADSNDRYGRLRAFVFSSEAGLEASVQHDMLVQGLARVASHGSGPACAAELFAREREARAAGRGLWADSQYAVRRADDPASVLAARGRMAVVEGRVLSVRESGGTIYVNFGRRWTEDFTVTIAKRNERVFTAGGMPPKQLERRQVRVRGWVEERGGPWIEATTPEQIELLGPQETRMTR